MFNVIRAVFKLRWKYTIRYPGWLILFIIFPIILSIIPIFLGWAVAGSPDKAAENFYVNVGTREYAPFMILGSLAWLISLSLMWDFGMWIREEQQMGTFEQTLLTPANIFHILLGSMLYTLTGLTIQFSLALAVAAIAFNFVDLLLTTHFLMATIYLILGIIPLSGFSLLIGSLVVRIKEAEGVARILQPILAFLIGIFYPITILPPLVKYLAISIPMTVSLQDIRAVLLDLEYIFNPYLDLYLLLIYCALWPLVGFSMFKTSLNRGRRRGDIGAY